VGLVPFGRATAQAEVVTHLQGDRAWRRTGRVSWLSIQKKLEIFNPSLSSFFSSFLSFLFLCLFLSFSLQPFFFSYNQPSLSKEVFRMRRGPGVPWPESHPSFRDALLPVWTVLEDVVSSTLHHICSWAGISATALLQECGEDPTQHKTKVIFPLLAGLSGRKDL